MENFQTIFNGEGLDVIFLKDKNRIEEKYKGFCEDDEITNAKMAFLEFTKGNQVKYWLSDMTNFQGASPDIQLWVRDEWLEMIYNAGIKHLGMVLSEDIFAVLSLDTALGGQFGQKATYEKFVSYKEADDWFLQFPV